MQQQPYQYTKGQVAVARARSSSDNVVLGVTFAIFFLLTFGYFMIDYFTSESYNYGMSDFERGVVGVLAVIIGATMFMGLLLGLGMFLVRMMRQTLLGNSMEVQYSAYAWLRDWANEVAADLRMPEVEIFVTQDPKINAFALGFARPYVIVLNSGSIRYLTRDELKVVVVHEMAHIKYYHTHALVYLQPFLSVPIINLVAQWIAGFWQRRTELTADRLALMYLEDADLVKSSLIKVHVGPDTADDMNEIARQWLQYKAERPMNRFAQTFSSHPFLVRRLSHIDRWEAIRQQPAPVYQPAIAPSPVVEQATETDDSRG